MTDTTVLEDAIRQVDRERSYLCTERCAFESFREAVRLAKPDETDETTADVLEAYRKEVMETIDYESVYGESLTESLEEELSPSLADALCSKEPLTQHRKRDLLVATTDAIERRERFLECLADERDALELYVDELSVIESAIEKLPECSPRTQSLERLLAVWNVYDTLEERCERLLERRQRQLREAESTIPLIDEAHARNEYLYGEIETAYPVLSAIAATMRRIESNRGSEKSSATGRSLEC